MSKERKQFELEYKRKVIEEYLTGNSTAQEIAVREGIDAQNIYRWKSQLESRAKVERIEAIQTEQGCSLEDARKIRELEEELLAYKAKVAEQAMMIDLLKKLQPNYQSEKKSSGFIEIKRELDRSKRRPK
jgi:transposase-like protein